MTSTTPDDPIVLGERYQLGDVLGRGGMADVHRATDRVLHREVAVKVLRDVAGEEHARSRFTAEARTLARLSHSSLVMVLDAGLAGDDSERPYLVMELVEGTTLGDQLRSGRVPLDRVREVGSRVAEALAYAHGQGVVHRDVKPGNVLLDGAGRVKLADFGIAKLLADTASHTKTGMTIGSAAYLSPEQVRGEPVTGAADVYSLGLVLLEAITGERTYSGPPMEAAVARLHRPPEVPGDLPPAWQQLLADMLVEDPAARPAAADVAARLRGIADDLAGETLPMTSPAVMPAPAPAVSATPPATPLAARTVAWVRGWEPHVRGVVAVGLALVAFLVVVAIAAGGGGGSADEIPAETPRRLQQPLQDLHDAVHGSTP